MDIKQFTDQTNFRKVEWMVDSKVVSAPRRDVVSGFLYGWVGFWFLAMRIGVTVGLIAFGSTLAFAEVPSWLYWVGSVAIVFSVLGGVIVLATGQQVNCPLCRASLFMSRRNLAKAGTARVCGSAKLPVAGALLCGSKVLRCPYCAERVRLRGEKGS